MSARHISTVYFYVISAASLALIVVGVFNSVNFAINITQYDKYPLRYQPENCDTNPYYKGPMAVVAPGATPSPQDLQNARLQCEKQLELDRKKQKLGDLKSAVTFSLVGVLLFLVHFPLARKQSKE